ncbi:MAG: HAMP domain-containing histidine kinase [Magnetococcus sp. MYC-9]
MRVALGSPRLRMLWRRTPLTSKALVASLVLGTLFWLSTDLWQTAQVRAIFTQRLLNGLEIQAQRDRIRLDESVRRQEQAVRLFSYHTPLLQYVEDAQQAWATLPHAVRHWEGERRPPWLPPRSVSRGLVAAPYIALLDKEKRLREIFFREEGLPPLPHTLPDILMTELLRMDENNHIVDGGDGGLYLISAAGLQDMKVSAHPTAFLLLIAPLNDEFLSLFHLKTETDSAVAFIHGENNRVFASSQPDKILAGMTTEQLSDHYMLFGKKFLDYSFAVDTPIHFATLVPLEQIALISEAIVQAERRQRAIGYAILTLVVLLLVFSIAHGVQTFTEGVVDTAVDKLGLQKQQVAPGDQLLIVAERFQWMTEEILRTRKQEKGRQAELQLSNQALQQSLVMVKRTQSKLVEAEKMASLGSLVAGVAHEINTPMGTGLTAASFLAQKSQECATHFAEGTLRKSELEGFFQDVAESTQMILQNLQRAVELIRSFKQMAVDRTNEERRTFRLQEYIHHVLLSLRPHLKQTRHTVTVHCPEELEIISYPGAFSQIITNLVFNSLLHGFHAQEEGHIFFQVEEREGDILFCYSDNGGGMEERDRLRVFEPFFTTARHRGGSGLGLHIVFNLVTQSLQGSIRCESSPGQGTRYEIRIPAASRTTER